MHLSDFAVNTLSLTFGAFRGAFFSLCSSLRCSLSCLCRQLSSLPTSCCFGPQVKIIISVGDQSWGEQEAFGEFWLVEDGVGAQHLWFESSTDSSTLLHCLHLLSCVFKQKAKPRQEERLQRSLSHHTFTVLTGLKTGLKSSPTVAMSTLVQRLDYSGGKKISSEDR